MALVTSLFHDAGYIREFGDQVSTTTERSLPFIT